MQSFFPKKKFITLIGLVFLTGLVFPFKAYSLTSTDLYRMSKFYVISKTEPTASATEYSNTFKIFIPENSPEMKSAFIEFTGVTKTTVDLQALFTLNDTSAPLYHLDTQSDTKFKILFDVQSTVNTVVNNKPGEYTFTFKYTLSGAPVSFVGAKIVLVYKYTISTGEYQGSGTLTSSTFDTHYGVTNPDGAAYNTLWWEQTIPDVQKTRVKIQLATSDNANGPWDFVGPTGLSNSYYTIPGELIWNGHNNQRYYRYKIYLETDDTSITPEVGEVRVNYSP